MLSFTRTPSKRLLSKTLQYIVLICLTVVFLYPITWLFINSFKSNQELFASPWTLPNSFALDNYIRAITVGNIGRDFLNSVIVAVAVVVITTFISAMAAYGITRFRWKLSDAFLSFFLFVLILPS